MRSPMTPPFGIDAYLEDCRGRVLAAIGRYLPADTRHTAGLYDLMLDYPLRPAKALRPALCLGACLALGGEADAALPSAAAFELFHNAFLVHDDVEDGSLVRRHGPTLHTTYGVPIAVNVGDGMLAVALEPLLDNVRVLGLGPALRIFKLIARMARESVEGQMLELDWIRRLRWDLPDREYLRMVHKKTAWYSFIAPLQVGAIAAGADRATADALGRFALTMGIAFQIQDDLLSLESTEDQLGKDALGDLWEGKYTLPLLHALRSLPGDERQEALAILARPRSAESARGGGDRAARAALLGRIEAAVPELAASDREMLRAALVGGAGGADGADRASTAGEPRDERAVRRLHQLVTGRGGASLDYARGIADRFARRALAVLEGSLGHVADSVHRRFLRGLVDFVIQRTR
jgi:geranylgeranyl diphosphate synthase type II